MTDVKFQVTVRSSNGVLTANYPQGRVVAAQPNRDGSRQAFDEELLPIRTFDFPEWERSWGETIKENQSFDILDLGYWKEDKSYEQPCHDWRSDLVERRESEGYPAISTSAVVESRQKAHVLALLNCVADSGWADVFPEVAEYLGYVAGVDVDATREVRERLAANHKPTESSEDVDIRKRRGINMAKAAAEDFKADNEEVVKKMVAVITHACVEDERDEIKKAREELADDVTTKPGGLEREARDREALRGLAIRREGKAVADHLRKDMAELGQELLDKSKPAPAVILTPGGLLSLLAESLGLECDTDKREAIVRDIAYLVVRHRGGEVMDYHNIRKTADKIRVVLKQPLTEK